jgi:RND family efflux transporter MFP subunit
VKQKLKNSNIEDTSRIDTQKPGEFNLNANGSKGSVKRSKRKIVFILLGLIIILIIGFRLFQFFSHNSPLESATINVKVETVKVGSITSTSPITGRIEPVEEVSITPMASGEVTTVNVKIGDHVSKDDILFQIEGAGSSASYNQAAASYDFAKTTYDRMSVLYKEGAVSKLDFEQSQVQFESALASYTLASEAYENTSVKSPINGFITSINVSVGSMASPGVPAATVADVSSLIINTNISEYLVGHIKSGDPVEIKISTLGDESYKGIVTAISPAPAKGTLTYPAEISVIDNNGKVKAGMFAEIRIITAEREKVISIPSDSVIVKNGKSLVVLINNNLPSYKEISTGLDNGTQVEVTKGLKTGDVIAIEGQQYITEGIMVNIVK